MFRAPENNNKEFKQPPPAAFKAAYGDLKLNCRLIAQALFPGTLMLTRDKQIKVVRRQTPASQVGQDVAKCTKGEQLYPWLCCTSSPLGVEIILVISCCRGCESGGVIWPLDDRATATLGLVHVDRVEFLAELVILGKVTGPNRSARP